MNWFKSHKLVLILSTIVVVDLIYFGAYALGGHNAPRTSNTKQPVAVSIAGLYSGIEQQRQLNGVPSLAHNSALDASARQKCDDMVNGSYYGHVNPITGKQGYTYVFSNIPSATRGDEILDQGDNPSHVYTSEDFMVSWMNSPDHRSAIIDPQYTDVGFAVCAVNGKQTVVGHLAAVMPAAKQTNSAESSASNNDQSIAQLAYEACLSYNEKAGGSYAAEYAKESTDTSNQAQVLLDELGAGQMSHDAYNKDMYDLYSTANTNRDNYYSTFTLAAPKGCKLNTAAPTHWPTDEYK